MLKLWKLRQTKNDGYDTYDSMVVAAATEDAARMITPGGDAFGSPYSGWCPDPRDVEIELIGEAVPGMKVGIILSSFNAG